VGANDGDLVDGNGNDTGLVDVSPTVGVGNAVSNDGGVLVVGVTNCGKAECAHVGAADGDPKNKLGNVVGRLVGRLVGCFDGTVGAVIGVVDVSPTVCVGIAVSDVGGSAIVGDDVERTCGNSECAKVGATDGDSP
jgi:hypothetical protein